MHHALAAKGCTQLHRGQHLHQRQYRGARPQLAAAIRAAVGRGDQHRRLAGIERRLDLGETADGEPGTPGKPYEIDGASRQQLLDPPVEVLIDPDRDARRPAEQALLYRAQYYIAPSKRPQTPARQALRHVRVDAVIGPKHEPDQLRLRAHLARHQAAPERPSLLDLERCQDLGRDLLLGLVGLARSGGGLARSGGGIGFIGEPVRARRHDDGVRVIGLEFQIGGHHLDELVAREIAEVVKRLHALLAEHHEALRRQAFDGRNLVRDTQLLALGLGVCRLLLEEPPRPLLQLGGDGRLEAFDPR